MQKGSYLNLTLFMANLTAGSSKEILSPSVIILLKRYDNRLLSSCEDTLSTLGEELKL